MDIEDWLTGDDGSPIDEIEERIVRTSRDAWDILSDAIGKTIDATLKERVRVNVMDFAEGKHDPDNKEAGVFIPASGGQPKPGKFSRENGPIMVEVANAFSDPEVDEITMLIAAQVGKSRTMLNMIIWAMEIAPGPITLVYPNDDMAEVKQDEDFLPTIWETPCVAKKVAPDEKKGQRDKGRRGRYTFPGGWIRFVSARSPSQVKGSPAQYLFIDEHAECVARAPLSPDGLAMPRTTQFANFKVVRLSTPLGSKDTCPTTKKYMESDQSRPFVKCPKCGHDHIMVWENVRFGVDSIGNKIAEGSTYECPSCKYQMIDPVRDAMISAAKWRQTAKHTCCGVEHDPLVSRNWDDDGIHKCNHCGKRASKKHRGFKAPTLYAYGVALSSLVQRFLDCKTPKDLEEFVNQTLAENFEPVGSFHADIVKSLGDHFEDYQELFGPDVQVPPGVKFVNMMADVQTAGQGRIEGERRGFGNKNESWGIDYFIIYGSPKERKTWEVFDMIRCMPMQGVDNRQFHVSMCGIDIGDGNVAQSIMEYIIPNQSKGIFALRGEKDADIYVPWHPNFSKHKYPHDVIGTYAARFELDKSLRSWYRGNDNARTSPPVENGLHFPKFVRDMDGNFVESYDIIDDDTGEVLATIGYPVDYCEQLTNFEQKPLRNPKTGQKEIGFKERSKSIREEALDIMCYHFGGRHRMQRRFNVDHVELIPDQWKMPITNHRVEKADLGRFNKASSVSKKPVAGQKPRKVWKFAPNPGEAVPLAKDSDKVSSIRDSNPFGVWNPGKSNGGF